MRSLLERISPTYLEQQRRLHQRPDGYGGKGDHWVDAVSALIIRYQASSLLDYGCGQGTLVTVLQRRPLGSLRLSNYDPAIKGKDAAPVFADLVTVTDVLEHIEPERLPAVLDHLHMLARKAVFFVIALVPANKLLDDGRNAHLIVESADWWRDRLTGAGFRLQSTDDLPFHRKFNPEASRRKRLVVIGEPC